MFSLIERDEGQQEVQTGWIFLSEFAEPASCAAVVLLPGLHHTQPGLGYCISWLLAKHLAQMSTCCLHFTWTRWTIIAGVRITVNQVQWFVLSKRKQAYINSLIHNLLTRPFPVTSRISPRIQAAHFGKVPISPLAKSMST